MNPPTYENESITKYLQKVESYKEYLIKDKYCIILNFVNDWLKLSNKLRLKSLTEFKNIAETDLINDDHNQDIIEKHRDKIQTIINLSLSVNTAGQDDNNFMILLVSKMLSSIGYYLHKRENRGSFYYTIKLL